MSLRRRNGGGGQGRQPQAAPRVRGAWTTPAVVVRAPDGSVVDRPTGPARGTSRGASKTERAPARTRVRPARRRVPPPGATGGVLASPTRAIAAGPAPSRSRANGSGGRPPRREARTKGSRRLVPSLRLDRLAPIDEKARERRNARFRWLGTRVGSVALCGLLVYAVFPVRTYLSQRSDTSRAREQLDVLSEENERLEQRADELRDPETVEEIARRDHNLVMPGEESYAILPPPEPAPEGDNPAEPGG